MASDPRVFAGESRWLGKCAKEVNCSSLHLSTVQCQHTSTSTDDNEEGFVQVPLCVSMFVFGAEGYVSHGDNNQTARACIHVIMRVRVHAREVENCMQACIYIDVCAYFTDDVSLLFVKESTGFCKVRYQPL